MKGKNFVVINGRHYDAVTGVAISDSAPVITQPISRNRTFHDIGPAATPAHTPGATRPNAHTSHAVHRKPQKSQTLHRAATKRPVTYNIEETVTPLAGRSPLITKFGPNKSHIKPHVADEATVVQHATEHSAAYTKPAISAVQPVKTAHPLAEATGGRAVKERLIKQKLAAAEPNTESIKRPSALKRLTSSHQKFASIATMSLAMVVLGGYLTYVNMPNLSVRVASARAGVDAQFPEYKPDGYSFAGPVAYAPGEVALNFRANGGEKSYEITQRASNWDSQAVLDNYVARETNNYLTYSEQGLTVYTYNNKAAWVNGGILYTIDGTAPLSSEQVLRIAGSM